MYNICGCVNQKMYSISTCQHKFIRRQYIKNKLWSAHFHSYTGCFIDSQPAQPDTAAQTPPRTNHSSAAPGEGPPCGRPDDGAAAGGAHVSLDRKVRSTPPWNSVWGHLGCDYHRCHLALKDSEGWLWGGQLWPVPQLGGHIVSPPPPPSATGRIQAGNNEEGNPSAGNVGRSWQTSNISWNGEPSCWGGCSSRCLRNTVFKW